MNNFYCNLEATARKQRIELFRVLDPQLTLFEETVVISRNSFDIIHNLIGQENSVVEKNPNMKFTSRIKTRLKD